MKLLSNKQERLLYQTLVINYIENKNFNVDPYEVFTNLGIEDDEVSSELMHEIESFIHLYSSRMIASAEVVKQDCLKIGALPVFGEAAFNLRELDPI